MPSNFLLLKKQAREWFEQHPADIWRVKASMRTLVVGGFITPAKYLYEDDMEKFFRIPVQEVSPGNVWRWRAAVTAVREMEGEGS